MDLLGPEAWKHREELEEVKVQMGITHDKFDCWIFKFLENKHYDVDETVAKLQRRAEMERGFLEYDITDHMKQTMRSGIMQIIGEDKDGRVAMYVVTRRDFPESKLREQRKQNFDMWLSYGTRLRRRDPRCRITLLVNQKDASVWSNTDMTFQTNIAFRISKFFPGMIDRAYVCCMGNALSACARPVIKAMPSAISDRIFIYNERQVFEDEKLLEFFDKDVLPRALGGENDCDTQENWNSFAEHVEGYFTDVKGAIAKGMSVKEYEQGLIDEEVRREEEKRRETERLSREQAVESARNFHQQLRRRRKGAAGDADGSPRGHVREASAVASLAVPPDGGAGAASMGDNQSLGLRMADETVSVFTCESEPFNGPGNPFPRGHGSVGDHDELSGSVGGCSYHPMSGALALAPENIRKHLEIVESLLRMEEQEALFRQSFYTQHEQWLQEYSRLFLSSRASVTVGDAEGVDQTEKIATECPAPARSVTHGALLTACVLLSILLLAATIFVLLSGSTITTVLFIAIFIDSLHLYPLGLALMILGHQCGLIGSRGFELSTSALRGQIVRPLTRFERKKIALGVQFSFFLAVCLIVLVVFVAFGTQQDPLSGLRVAIGSGIYSCAIALALYHIGFPFGLSPEKRRSKNQGGLSLYLFLDITENEQRSVRSRGGTSGMVVVTTPVVIAVLFGACFMITPSLFYIVATVASTLGAAFAVNHFVSGNHTNINGNIMRATTWIVCVYWIFLSFTVGFFGWDPAWRDAILGSSAVAVYFLIITALCYLCKEGSRAHRWSFRVAYASCLLLALSGVVIMFFVSWVFGLVMGALLIHSFFCFLRPSSTAFAGTFVTTCCTLFVSLTVVLYAFQIINYEDGASVSDATLEFEQPAELPHPICLQRWGGLQASDLALFNRISYFANSLVIEESLTRVLPDFRLGGVIPSRDVAILKWYENVAENLIVASIVPASDHMGAIAGLTMWAEGIGLQPYASVLPTNWTSAVVDSVAYLTLQFNHRYKLMLTDFRAQMASLKARVGSNRVVLTGHSLGGGIASVIGAQTAVQTLGFEAPGLLTSKNKFDVSEWSYLKFVTVINTQRTLLGGVDSHGPSLQTVQCSDDLLRCSRPVNIFCSLRTICGSSSNRSLESCVAGSAATPPPVPLPPPTGTSAGQ